MRIQESRETMNEIIAKEGLLVEVNGKDKILPEDRFLLTLLKEFEINEESKGVAVAVQDSLVRKSEWASRILESGDRIEIITAAQGG